MKEDQTTTPQELPKKDHHLDSPKYLNLQDMIDLTTRKTEVSMETTIMELLLHSTKTLLYSTQTRSSSTMTKSMDKNHLSTMTNLLHSKIIITMRNMKKTQLILQTNHQNMEKTTDTSLIQVLTLKTKRTTARKTRTLGSLMRRTPLDSLLQE